MPHTKLPIKTPVVSSTSTPDSLESTVTPPKGRVSILVIEDEASLRSVLSQALKMDGYSVVEAANGMEGVERFHDTFPDVVITDIWMPEADGLEATLQLIHDFPDVKIIAITGGSGDRDCLGVAQFFGARRTLKKPFAIPALLQTVREVLAEPRRRERPGRKPRTYPRFAVQCPAAFCADEAQGMGKVLNLSRGGCALESAVNLPAGSYVALEIFLPTGAPLAVDLARVQWTTGLEFGLAFIRMAPPSQQALQGFLTGLQRDVSRESRP